jgi:hypothetical protein
MRIIAFVTDPEVVGRILRHVAEPTEAASAGSACAGAESADRAAPRSFGRHAIRADIPIPPPADQEVSVSAAKGRAALSISGKLTTDRTRSGGTWRE